MAIEQRLDEAQELVRAHQQLNDYLSRGNLLPQNSALGLLNETNSFLRENPNLFPKDPEESLYVEEARRRLGVHSRSLELRLTGKPITMSEITTLYGIEVQDLSTIEPWLVDPENKTRIKAAAEENYINDPRDPSIHPIANDIPQERINAFRFGERGILSFTRALSSLITNTFVIGHNINQVQVTATEEARSYYSPHK